MSALPADFDLGQLDIQKQLLEIEKFELEQSLMAFLEAAWPHFDPAPFSSNWHIEAVAEHLEAITDGGVTRLIINVPPRSCKTSLCSIVFPAWVWAQREIGPNSGPQVKFLYASYGESLSLDHSVMCRRLIKSEWYQERWGDRFNLLSDADMKSRFDNDKGGNRQITSIGGRVTGKGADCVVEGTLVATPTGDTPIEKLSVGDFVLAFDHESNRTVTRQVQATRKAYSQNLVRVWTKRGNRLTCTADHRIFARSETYTQARFLRYSIELEGVTGKDEVSFVEPMECLVGQPVYDIQVEGCHNFFANGVLVHNCIIIDDPNATNDISDTKLDEVTNWFDNTIRSRLNDKRTGAICLIQQRTAENDLTGHILENYTEDGYQHVMVPLEYEPDRSFETSIGWKDPRTYLGEPLWPERFDEKFVRAEKKNRYVFAGQYQQRPEIAGGGIIKREWWTLWDNPVFPPMDYVLASLDTAFTAKTSNDPSAMTIWGVFTDDAHAVAGRSIGTDGKPIYIDRAYNEGAPKLMLIHAWTEHLEFFDLLKKVELTCRHMKVDKLLIENKASGISLAQELRRLGNCSDFGVQLCDPKSLDKMARLFSVQHIFEEGIIHAPDKAWAEQVITQVGQFPKGKHDDLVDSSSMAIRHLRDMGLLTRSGERLEEIESAITYPNGQNVPLYPC